MQTANAARKRRALFALLLLLALCLTACGQVGGADIDLGPSQRFSAEELRAGAETVLREFFFQYDGCALEKLYYEQELCDAEAARLSGKRPPGATNGATKENTLVLLADFSRRPRAAQRTASARTAATRAGSSSSSARTQTAPGRSTIGATDRPKTAPPSPRLCGWEGGAALACRAPAMV